MFRAVIYPRVSSAGQRERQTVLSQLTTLPTAIAARGWELARPADHYLDDGRTARAGHLEARDGLRRLLRDAAGGVFDVVVVVDVDRVTRSEDLIERATILETLRRAGVLISEGGAEPRAADDLVTQIRAALAAEENRKRTEAVRRGKLAALARGKHPGGRTPYGVRWTGEGYELDPPAAEVRREIARRLVAGESCEVIGVDLERRGVARPSGCARWSRSTVYKLAVSSINVGRWLVHKRRGVVIAVPAALDEPSWRTALDALRDPAKSRTGLRHTRGVYLLEGIARCAICGRGIGINSRGTGGHKLVYYTCLNKRARHRRTTLGGQVCPLPMRRIADVDARVWAATVELIATPGRLEQVIATWRDAAGEERRDWQADERAALAALERVRRAERQVLELVDGGDAGIESARGRLAELRRRREQAERDLEAARAGAQSAAAQGTELAGVIAGIETLRQRLAEATPQERYELVHLLFPAGWTLDEVGRACGRAVVGVGSVRRVSWSVEHGADGPEVEVVA